MKSKIDQIIDRTDILIQRFDTFSTEEQRQSLTNKVAEASSALKKFPKGNMGLTPDHIRNSPEYQKAKKEYEIHFQALRSFNTKYKPGKRR